MRKIRRALLKIRRIPPVLWAIYFFSLFLVIFATRSIIFSTNKDPICRECIVPREKVSNDIKDLTFVTFANRKDKANSFFAKNIKSWLKTSEGSKVLIFRNKNKFDKKETWLSSQFPHGRVSYIAGKRTDFRKELYTDDLFDIGAQLSTSKYTVFIRPDVFLTDSWFPIVEKVVRAVENGNVTVVGPSKVNENEFSNDSDFYVVNLFDERFKPSSVPPFLTSREYWPEWMLGYLDEITTLVSIGEGDYVIRNRKELSAMEKKDMRTDLNRCMLEANRKYSRKVNDVKWIVNGNTVASKSKKIEL